jgi:DNA-binding transcriptional regulator YhcF (GntR family)
MLAPLYERLLLPGTQVNLALVKESEMFEQEKILILQKIVEKRPIKDSQIANDLNLDIHKVRVILNQLKESKFIKSIEHKQSHDPSSPKIELVLVTEITSEGCLALKGEIPLNTNTNFSSVVHINSGNFGIGHMSGGEIKDGAKVAGVINEAEQQNLADAAAAIQRLLKQLEETNPLATQAEQQAYVTASIPPTLRKRFVSALQAGWKEAIKEFLDNPYVNVGVATLEGWQEAE